MHELKLTLLCIYFGEKESFRTVFTKLPESEGDDIFLLSLKLSIS